MSPTNHITVSHHCATSLCDIIVWHHCATSMSDITVQHHCVTSLWDITVWHHSVTSQCDTTVWQPTYIHVSTPSMLYFLTKQKLQLLDMLHTLCSLLYCKPTVVSKSHTHSLSYQHSTYLSLVTYTDWKYAIKTQTSFNLWNTSNFFFSSFTLRFFTYLKVISI